MYISSRLLILSLFVFPLFAQAETLRGEFSRAVVDRLDGLSETQSFIELSDFQLVRLNLSAVEDQLDQLEANSEIQIEGEMIGTGVFLVDSMIITPATGRALSGAVEETGVKKRAVSIFLPENSVCSESEAEQILRDVAKHTHIISNGQSELIIDLNEDGRPDVFQLAKPSNRDCYREDYHQTLKQRFFEEMNEFLDGREDIAKSLAVPIDRNAQCGFDGITDFYGETILFTRCDPRILIHEIGHNEGLGHAMFDVNGDGRPGGNEEEYGEYYSLMGRNFGFSPYQPIVSVHNSLAQLHLGWIGNDKVSSVPAQFSGEFVISPLQDWESDSPKVLKLSLQNPVDFWDQLYVSYRKPSGSLLQGSPHVLQFHHKIQSGGVVGSLLAFSLEFDVTVHTKFGWVSFVALTPNGEAILRIENNKPENLLFSDETYLNPPLRASYRSKPDDLDISLIAQSKVLGSHKLGAIDVYSRKYAQVVDLAGRYRVTFSDFAKRPDSIVVYDTQLEEIVADSILLKQGLQTVFGWLKFEKVENGIATFSISKNKPSDLFLDWSDSISFGRDETDQYLGLRIHGWDYLVEVQDVESVRGAMYRFSDQGEMTHISIIDEDSLIENYFLDGSVEYQTYRKIGESDYGKYLLEDFLVSSGEPDFSNPVLLKVLSSNNRPLALRYFSGSGSLHFVTNDHTLIASQFATITEGEVLHIKALGYFKFRKLASGGIELIFSETRIGQGSRVGSTKPCIDNDGDGWGWDGERSCVVKYDNQALSSFECRDEDGDGWGWIEETQSSCKI